VVVDGDPSVFFGVVFICLVIAISVFVGLYVKRSILRKNRKGFRPVEEDDIELVMRGELEVL
jgi:uncharacterized protein YneF (UPF0154 family)